MKFINSIEKLKINYMYSMSDGHKGSWVILLKEVYPSKSEIYFEIINDRSGVNTGVNDSLHEDYISKVKETSKNFQSDKYAWYEIGLVEDFPEYFL